MRVILAHVKIVFKRTPSYNPSRTPESFLRFHVHGGDDAVAFRVAEVRKEWNRLQHGVAGVRLEELRERTCTTEAWEFLISFLRELGKKKNLKTRTFHAPDSDLGQVTRWSTLCVILEHALLSSPDTVSPTLNGLLNRGPWGVHAGRKGAEERVEVRAGEREQRHVADRGHGRVARGMIEQGHLAEALRRF